MYHFLQDLRKANSLKSQVDTYKKQVSQQFTVFFEYFLVLFFSLKLLTVNISLTNAYNISLSYQVHQLQVQVSDLQRRADKVCILCISLHRVNTGLNN